MSFRTNHAALTIRCNTLFWKAYIILISVSLAHLQSCTTYTLAFVCVRVACVYFARRVVRVTSTFFLYSILISYFFLQAIFLSTYLKWQFQALLTLAVCENYVGQTHSLSVSFRLHVFLPSRSICSLHLSVVKNIILIRWLIMLYMLRVIYET